MKLLKIIFMMCLIAIGAQNVYAMGRRPAPQDDIALPNHPGNIVFDSLAWSIPLGDEHRVILNNGIDVAYVATDSLLPLVNIEAHFRSGSLEDADELAGVSALLARLMRTGGTKNFPADTLDELLDRFAIQISFAQSESHIQFRASFLADFTDTALHIISEMIFAPAFEQERFERERGIMNEQIRHRFTNPAPTLSLAYRKHKYPQSAPSRLTTEASLANITREKLFELHVRAFLNREMFIAVSGMFNRDEMIAKLNDIFGAEKLLQKVAWSQIAIAPQTRALVVHHTSNQAYIRMGLPLFTRPHPDYYAVMVMNYILGGSGFSSRLATRVRSDEGLTYSIHSVAESNYTYDGTMFINFFTKIETYPKAVSIILEELEKFIADGVTESELSSATTSLISELPSSFRSTWDIVSTYSWNEFYGRSSDHYIKFIDELNKLTTDDILNAARKYIDFEKMTYTIVGDTALINTVSKSAADNGLFSIDIFDDKKTIIAEEIPALP